MRWLIALTLALSGPFATATPAPVGTVFVCDGAGDYRKASQSFRKVLADERRPLTVETVVWSHGYMLRILDHCHYQRARLMGVALAQRLVQERRQAPDHAIYLVGHSAGSGVVLAAAEHAAPGVIDRVILLGASLSADYDLRPALRHTRVGVDSFYSQRDVAILGLVMSVAGNSDRRWGLCAGRCGFRPPVEPDLRAKLRQHPWRPEDGWTGNQGAHCDWYRPDYLRCYILPLLGAGG